MCNCLLKESVLFTMKPTLLVLFLLFQISQSLILDIIYDVIDQPGLKNKAAFDEWHFFDFDHTLANTVTLVPMLSSSGEFLRFADSKCSFQQPHEHPDYSVFTLEKLLLTTPVFDGLTNIQNSIDSGAFVVILTMRGSVHARSGIIMFLREYGIQVHAVIQVDKKPLKTILDTFNIASGLRKSLIVLSILRHQAACLPLVVQIHEDSDSQVNSYLQTLPMIYPHVQYSITDYVKSQQSYEAQLMFISQFTGWRFATNMTQVQELPKYVYNSFDC